MINKLKKRFMKSIIAESFKDPKRVLYFSLFEILLIAIIIALAFPSALLIKNQVMNFDIINPVLERIKIFQQSAYEEKAKFDSGFIKDVSDARGLITSTIRASLLVIFIFFALAFIALAAFKGLEYNLMIKQKYDLAYFKKFLLMKVIWVIAWLILLTITFLIFKSKIAAFLIFTGVLLFMHFTIILHALFDKTKKLFYLIKHTLIKGITKLHHFLLGYVIAFVVFYIASLILFLASKTFGRGTIYLVILAILALLYFSWLRIYLGLIARKVALK